MKFFQSFIARTQLLEVGVLYRHASLTPAPFRPENGTKTEKNSEDPVPSEWTKVFGERLDEKYRDL